jgi:hypothetical protein
VLGVGSRTHQGEESGWIGYPVDELALRHGAGVERATGDVREAYGALPDPEPTRYGGWLSD